MSYSDEIPESERQDIEDKLDEMAGDDLQKKQMLDELSADIKGVLDRVQLLGELKVKGIDVGCIMCGETVFAVENITEFDGVEVITALPVETLQEMLSAMMIHIIQRHTMGLTPSARTILLLRNLSN